MPVGSGGMPLGAMGEADAIRFGFGSPYLGKCKR